MAPTMKHRRSSSKRKSKRGANRYDKILTKFKKIKKLGGTVVREKNGKNALPHRVTKENPEHKGEKVIIKKSKKK